MKRDTRTAYRARAAATERSVDEALAEVHAAYNAKNAERNKPVPFTTEELQAARAVRTSVGWHRVARVNTKTVSVETGYSWNDRYTFDKILEVRL